MTLRPPHPLSKTQPTQQPFTTTTSTATTTTTMSTTTIKLSPYEYETGPLPPPNTAQAAIIKVLEEAVKIEHQRRERERIAARQQMEQQRPRRHALIPASFRSTRIVSRCPCGSPWPGRTSFPGIKIGQWNLRSPRIGCFCGSGYRHRQRKEELLEEIERNSPNVTFRKVSKSLPDNHGRDSDSEEDTGSALFLS